MLRILFIWHISFPQEKVITKTVLNEWILFYFEFILYFCTRYLLSNILPHDSVTYIIFECLQYFTGWHKTFVFQVMQHIVDRRRHPTSFNSQTLLTKNANSHLSLNKHYWRDTLIDIFHFTNTNVQTRYSTFLFHC